MSASSSSERTDRGGRPRRGWGALSAAQRRTGVAALLVVLSLGAPWYATEVVFRARPGERAPVTHGTLSGFSAFSFVEGAVLLVALAVLALTWARATKRAFSLPGRDGTVVTAAAGWIGVLIVYRLFDRPAADATANSTTLIGLSWGIFVSLAAVGLLLVTGLDQRRSVPSRRAARADDDGPVVDPATVVAPRPDEDDAGWSVPAPRQRAADGRPRERRAAGEPPPRPRGSDRRPAAHDDDTRALGRDDAAALLRDAGLGPDQPARSGGSRDDEAATRAVRPAEDDAATRAVRPSEDEPTRAVRPSDDEPTRAVRPSDDEPARAARPPADPAADPTRVAPEAPPEREDDATLVQRWRHRRRSDRR